MPYLQVDIEPMHSDDLRDCALTINRRYSHYPNRLRDPSVTPEARLLRQEAMLRSDLDDPSTSNYVAKYQGKVVGWSSWTRPNTSRVVALEVLSKANNTEPDPERDHELVKAYQNDKKAKREKFLGDKTNWTLNNLFVHPSYRRSGIAGQMFHFGLNMIQEETPGAFLQFSASPMGRPMYEKYGCKVLDWFEYTVDDLDENGKMVPHRYRWPYMANHWEGQEDAAERAAQRTSWEGKIEPPEVL